MRLVTAFSILYFLFLCFLTWGALYPRPRVPEARNMAVERYCLTWAVSAGIGKDFVDASVIEWYFDCIGSY